MLLCTKCGTPLPDNIERCEICGQPVQADQAPVPAQPKRTFKFSPVDATVEPGEAATEIAETPAAAEDTPAGMETLPATEPPAAAVDMPAPPAAATASEPAPVPIRATPPQPAESKPRRSRARKAPQPLAEDTSDLPQATTGQPTRVMRFGPETEVATAPEGQPTPGDVQTPPQPPKPAIAEPVAPRPIRERPVVTITKRLMRDRRFVTAALAVLLAAVLIPYGLSRLLKPRDLAVEKSGITEKQIAEFDQLVDSRLPDKLEWGREIMRRRLPARFPEELMLEKDTQEHEIEFDDKSKDLVSYQFKVAYHFNEDPKAVWTWQAVTFFFRQVNGKWTIYGDKWMREDEVHFE